MKNSTSITRSNYIHQNYTFWFSKIFLTSIIIFLTLSKTTIAQVNYVDSIYNIINTSKNDSIKSINYQKLAKYYYKIDKSKTFSFIDSSKVYSKKTNNTRFYILTKLFSANTKLYDYKYRDALKEYNEILIDYTNLNDTENIALSLGNIGLTYYDLAEYDTAKAYFLQSVKYYTKIKKYTRAAQSLNNIGIIYDIYNKPVKALEYYFKALNIYEKQKEYNYFIGTIGNITVVYLNQKQYKNSIELSLENIHLLDSINNDKSKIDFYQNLAVAYDDIEDYENAIKYYKIALDLALKLDDKLRIARVYTNLSASYSLQEKKELSLSYAIKAIEIKEQLEDVASLAASQIGLADSYRSYGYYYNSIKYYLKGLENAKKIKYNEYIKTAYIGLSYVYSEIGDYKNAYYYQSEYIELNNKLINSENNKMLTEIKTKYQTEKKEQQIKLQKERIEKQEIKQQKTNLQRNFFIISSILTLLLAFIILISLRQKKKANKILLAQKAQISEQNEELNQQNEEITAQRDEIEAQRNTVILQKNKIEEIHSRISDSIEYAKRIQQSILPKKSELLNYFSENFVFFKPKDVVSGDFYWWKDTGDKTIITAADCTGHGVPGAFMSMLGISLLREIVEKEKITKPYEILNLLRNNIISSLQQSESNKSNLSVKDGIDMSLICINHKTNTLEYSGANNPIYIIRDNKIIPTNEKIIEHSILTEGTNSHRALYELKPNKMPIAIYTKNDTFTSIKIHLEKGDQIYMFSDGYADQFGGENGKKFKYKPFKKLLIENAKKPMKEQKEILLKTFIDWKGNYEQIDDIVVLGIKI